MIDEEGLCYWEDINIECTPRGAHHQQYIFQYFNHHNLLEKGSLEKSKKVLFLMAGPFFSFVAMVIKIQADIKFEGGQG